MDKVTIGAWNVKGLSSALKSDTVNTFIRTNRVDVMGLIETRIREVNSSLLSRFGNYWNMVNNLGIARYIKNGGSLET